MGQDIKEQPTAPFSETKDPLRRQGYNPKKLLLWGTNPNFFEQDMPRALRETRSMWNLPNMENTQAGGIIIKIREHLDYFFTKSPEVIIGNIYREWATSNGLTRKQDFLGKEIDSVIPIDELDETQHRAWEVYTMNGEVSREVALSITQQLIFMIPQPDVRYIPDESLHYLHDNLEKARMQLVAKIFPDLIDEEAKFLFGQLTTAQEILKEDSL